LTPTSSSARLRSIVITLAQTGLFRARWSEDVHREWMRAVVEKRRDLTPDKLEPTRRAMDRAVSDCLVTGYEPISGLTLPDRDDQHVLAAAITARASVIVTFDVGDFPADALQLHGIHATHPDDFILDVESLDSPAVIKAARDDLRHYANPPLTVDAYLNDLRRAGVPKTADHLGRFKILLEGDQADSNP
jgi:predicted nucleic acid-binding protein